MAALDTSVKIFDSSMPGVPTLSNVAGNLIAVLDACLVNGFGQVTCDAVVVTGGVATATIASGHAAWPQAVVSLAGATPSGLNGEHKVINTSTNTVIFDAFGVADGTASGTITLKLAPAGWTKAFSGTNLAAYKSPNPLATGSYLRVDDTGTTNARAVGYVTMSDVNTGTTPFPTAAQLPGGAYLPKSSASGSRKWWLIANDRIGYFAVAAYSSYPTAVLLSGFGDIVAKKSGDAYRFALFACDADRTTTSSLSSYQPISCASSTAAKYLPRSYSTLGSPVTITTQWLNSAQHSSSGASGSVFPNPEDNGILFVPMYVTEGATYRGKLPGIYATPQDIENKILDAFILDEASGFARKVMYRQTGASASYWGGVFFDLTGPWET